MFLVIAGSLALALLVLAAPIALVTFASHARRGEAAQHAAQQVFGLEQLPPGVELLDFNSRSTLETNEHYLLRLTPAAYADLLNRVRLSQPVNDDQADWWWPLPTDAQIFHVRTGHYAFSPAQCTVHVHVYAPTG
jgi:hypothetical protein